MFNSFSRRRIVKVAVGFVAGIACIVQTQTIVQAQAIKNGIYGIRSQGTIRVLNYLDGRTGNGTVGLVTDFRAVTGARWEIIYRGGYYTIRSCGTTRGPDYLDGRTGNGTVGLAPTFGGAFSGARWSILKARGSKKTDIYDYVIVSLGTTPGNRYLDGRTGDKTVGLAPTYTGGFTGAKWTIGGMNESCPGGPG